MNRGVTAGEVVHIVGSHQPQAGLLGDFHQTPVDPRLLRKAVILELQIKIIRAEHIPVAAGQIAGGFSLAPGQQGGNLSAQAAA